MNSILESSITTLNTSIKALNYFEKQHELVVDGVVRRMIGVLVRATATKTMDESVLLTGAWDTQTGNIDGATLVADVLEVRTTLL